MEIPLFKIYTDENDVSAVAKVIKSGRDWAIGKEVSVFEKNVARYVGARYAVAFNSGTSALHAMLIAFGIGKGDEVIVPSFTFIATANACLMTGAKPVFAEIEDETYGLDPNDVEKKITKKTKAIMLVHYGGTPCKIKELQKIAKKRKLLLLEDAAESLGAEVGGKKVGTFGQAAMFSFCGPKVVTTGEGGIIVTNSNDACEKMKLVRSHGRKEQANYFSSSTHVDYVSLGYNFRMSNITAALGVSQLKKIATVVKMRTKNAHYLTHALSKLDHIILPTSLKGYGSVHQMYTIRIKKGKNTRDKLKEYLNKEGIMAKVYFDPVHLTDFYKNTFGYKRGDLPITEALSDTVLTLPMYPSLSEKEMRYIARAIKVFFKK